MTIYVSGHHAAAWWLGLAAPIAGVIGAIVAVAAYVFIPGVRQAVNEVTVAILKVAIDAIWFVLKPLVDTVTGLVQFVGEFLNAIAQLFAGDFPRAIFRIVLIAAYLWVFDLAKSIPVIKDILDTILSAAQQVTKFANDLFDQAQRGLEALRHELADSITNLFQAFPELAKALRQDIVATVDTLIGRLEGRLAQARFEILAHVDLVGELLRARVTILGQTFSATPDVVRQYLLSFDRYHPRVGLDQAQALFASVLPMAPPVSPADVAPWALLDTVIADMDAVMAGGSAPEDDAVNTARAQMQQLLLGTVPELEDFPPPPELEPPTEPEPSLPVPPELLIPA